MYSTIDSGDCGIVAADVVRLSIVGTLLTVTQNGIATVLSVIDTSLSAAGDVGLGIGNIKTATDDAAVAFRFDTFTVIENPADVSTASQWPWFSGGFR